MVNGELIIDNFAGGGGASTGIELATGVSVDIAINHDPEAIRMHEVNHPATKHYCESVWDVDPVKACAGRPVALGIVKFGKYGNDFHLGFHIYWINCPHLRNEICFWDTKVRVIGNIFDNPEISNGGD